MESFLLSEYESDPVVIKMKSIIKKLYNGKNLSDKDITFSSPYIINRWGLESYIEDKLILKGIPPEDRKQYDDIWNILQAKGFMEEQIIDILPLLSNEDLQELIYKQVNSDFESLHISPYSYDIELLLSVYEVYGQDEAERLRDNLESEY